MYFFQEKDSAILGVYMSLGGYDISYSDLTPEVPHVLQLNIAGQSVYKTKSNKALLTDCSGKLVLTANGHNFVMEIDSGVVITIISDLNDNKVLFGVIGYKHPFNTAKKKLNLIYQLGLISKPEKLDEYLSWCKAKGDNNIIRNRDLYNAINYVQNFISENHEYESANPYMKREMLLSTLCDFEEKKRCFYDQSNNKGVCYGHV